MTYQETPYIMNVLSIYRQLLRHIFSSIRYSEWMPELGEIFISIYFLSARTRWTTKRRLWLSSALCTIVTTLMTFAMYIAHTAHTISHSDYECDKNHRWMRLPKTVLAFYMLQWKIHIMNKTWSMTLLLVRSNHSRIYIILLIQSHLLPHRERQKNCE